jgi:hypothetical protein
MAAAATEVSGPTPAPHALVLPPQQTLPGFVLASAPRPLHSSRSALALSGLLLLAGLWASWDRLAGFFSSSFAAGRGQRSAAGVSSRPDADDMPRSDMPRSDMLRSDTRPTVESTHAAAVPAALEEPDFEHGASPSGTPASFVRRAGAAVAPAPRAEAERGAAISGKRLRRLTPFAEARARSAEPARVPGCDPPTYMDAAGIRHFKKDCL